jgi:hypothetical protein
MAVVEASTQRLAGLLETGGDGGLAPTFLAESSEAVTSNLRERASIAPPAERGVLTE